MEGFGGDVDRALAQIRDLFGSPTGLRRAGVGELAPDAAGPVTGWSGQSQEGHSAAAAAFGTSTEALREADAELDALTQAIAGDTATARQRAEDLIASSRAVTASLTPDLGAVPAAAALSRHWHDVLAQASQIVTDHAERVPDYQQRLTALADRYAALTAGQ